MSGAGSRRARILLFDIETAPLVGTVWQKYEADLIWMVQEWYMLCFAYKWLDESKTHVIAQPDFESYKPGSPNDYHVVKELHRLISEADIVIAHNGNSFDVKKANARFIFHGLGPTVPAQQVDTLRMARKYFALTSNKLDDIGEYLGVGRKIRTDKGLWRACMAGEEKAWRKMKSYNKQDVRLLEQVYLKLLPYDTGHPNRANIEGRPRACKNCGVEGFLWAQGWRYTKTGKYRRYQCKSCGTFINSRQADKSPKPDYV